MRFRRSRHRSSGCRYCGRARAQPDGERKLDPVQARREGAAGGNLRGAERATGRTRLRRLPRGSSVSDRGDRVLGHDRLGYPGRARPHLPYRHQPRRGLRAVRARSAPGRARRFDDHAEALVGSACRSGGDWSAARPARFARRPDRGDQQRLRLCRSVQVRDLAGGRERRPQARSPRDTGTGARRRAADLHGAGAALQGSERRRGTNREPAPARLPAGEARDPAPNGGGGQGDD